MKTLLLLTLPLLLFSKHLHHEKYYQEKWCKANGGIVEYRLKDGTRVDCLTDEYAIEFDFAVKWAEAIGQSLYYGIMTNHKPAIFLIIEKPKEKRYLKRLKTVTDTLDIKILN